MEFNGKILRVGHLLKFDIESPHFLNFGNKTSFISLTLLT